jgi:hypothetical protein
MNSSKKVDAMTIREWRELGFFYDRDDVRHEWKFIGSSEGLLQFVNLLLKYVANPRNGKISEHDHYGPYWYLKIVTWTEPLISKDIRGTLADFQKLANLVRSKIEASKTRDVFTIDKEYSAKNEFVLKFFIKENGFDPAQADTQLPN